MSHIRAVYELRRFTRSSDLDFQSALQLYIRLIPGSIRTHSNEISYWLESYTRFKPDEFCVCGFYSNDTIIGYAQFAYFYEERVIAFDYLLLHEDHRMQGQYFQFIQMLKQWVEEQNWEIDYVVAEIAVDHAPAEGNKQPPLIELFKQVGFAVADCSYYQPQLGLNNEQSDIPAHFLVRSGDKCQFLQVPVFIKLVHTVYFRHYGRWYEQFLGAQSEYETLLRKRFTEIKAAAERAKNIELDGVKTQIPQTPSPPPAKSRRNRQYFSSVCVAALVLAVCFCLLLFQRVFARDTSTVLSCLGASLVVSFAAFALFYKNGQRVFSELLRFLKSFGKRKSR